MRNLQEQVKKAFCYQNCSDLSLLEKIILVILIILRILSFQPQISTVFSRSVEQVFLTVGQNNFGNKIPLFWIFASMDWKCSLKFSKVYITFTHCRLWHYADCCLSIFVLYSLNFCPLTFCSEGEAWISTFFHTCNSILFKMG
jgi:hypothetical protein